MQGILQTETGSIPILWEEDCGIIERIKAAPALEGQANNIQGEVFFYQYELDIPFNGEEKEVLELGDVVYWRSTKRSDQFGLLFMYGNTTYGDGRQPRTSSPGIKIGRIADYQKISAIKTGSHLKLL